VAEWRHADEATQAHSISPVEVEVTPRPVPVVEPEPSAPATPGHRGRGVLIALGVAVLLAVGGLVLFNQMNEETPEGTPRADENGGRGRSGAGAEEEPPDIGPTKTFVAGDTGFGVDVPADWEERPQADTRIDLVDPDTGDYLRVEWIQPPGDDAVAAWESQEGSFAPSHENYERIRLDAVEFQDSPSAALWEYTWSDGEAQLHAYNLGFVTADREYGFALNLVADEANWDDVQPLWKHFKSTFGPN
jgi:hypothetical protein